MKPIFWRASLLLIVLVAISCNNKPEEPKVDLDKKIRDERISHNKKVLDEAVKNDDYFTAMMVTYDLMVDDTAQEMLYLDSLAVFYELNGLPAPALKVAERILAKDPANEAMIQLKARALFSTGKGKEAMELQEKLYEKSKDVNILFAKLQVDASSGNMKSVENTLKLIENHIKDRPNDSVEVGTDKQGVMQRVPASAAFYFMKGEVAYAKEQYPQALTYFQRAKKIYPKFVAVDYALQQWSAQQRGLK